MEGENAVREHPNHPQLRLTVQESLDRYMYDSACFFAKKLGSRKDDVFSKAHTSFMAGHYQEAITIINKSPRAQRKLARNRYLAAKCHVELGEWAKCLLKLEDIVLLGGGELNNPNDVREIDGNTNDAQYPRITMLSSMAYLKGKAHRGLGHIDEARKWYQAALQANRWCYEALISLTDGHMLSCEEEIGLLSRLLRVTVMGNWPQSLYACLIKKENFVGDNMSPTAWFAIKALEMIWDMENVAVLRNKSFSFTKKKIFDCLKNVGYIGPINLTVVVGERDRVKHLLGELDHEHALGLIRFVPVGSSEKQASDTRIKELLEEWSEEHIDPANICMIAGDGDYKEKLFELKGYHHNLLTITQKASSTSWLRNQGYSNWDWEKLMME